MYYTYVHIHVCIHTIITDSKHPDEHQAWLWSLSACSAPCWSQEFNKKINLYYKITSKYVMLDVCFPGRVRSSTSPKTLQWSRRLWFQASVWIPGKIHMHLIFTA